ncbi:thiamine phosphate synthase [Thalassiella azotivora]
MPVPPLLVVTDRRAHTRPLLRTVTQSVEAGARAVLLREKDLPDGERRVLAASLAQVLAPVGGLLVVGGAVTAPGATGCHLAADDPVPRNRPRVLGRSCHDEGEVRRAVEERVDYVTASPVAASSSKPGYGPPLGEDGLRALVDAAEGVPVLALGGVTVTDAARWVAAGAAGVAVMGAVMGADDPGRVVRALLRELDEVAP